MKVKIGPAGFGPVDDGYKKFAELIVKECVDIADETALGDTTYGWMVANRIKEHFGVEE
jgi:hypothetical protein